MRCTLQVHGSLHVAVPFLATADCTPFSENGEMDAADLQKIKPHLCPAALLIDMAAAFFDYETTSELINPKAES